MGTNNIAGIPDGIIDIARTRYSDYGLLQLKNYLAIYPEALFAALKSLYHHLDPIFIPSDPTPSPETIRILDLAGIALITLLQHRTEQILEDLFSVLDSWPYIWMWVDFFTAHHAALALFPQKTFLRIRSAILVACRDGLKLSLSELVTADAVRTVFTLWITDKHHPKGVNSQQMDFDHSFASVIQPLLECYAPDDESPVLQEFNTILVAVVEEEADAIASAALARFRYSSSRPFSSEDECLTVMSDLHILEGLMKCSPIVYHEMLSRRLIVAVTNFLTITTSKAVPGDETGEDMCKMISVSEFIILKAVDSPYNGVWFTQAFEGRIFRSILRTIPWIQWEQTNKDKSLVASITGALVQILLMPLVHLEAYRAARRTMAEIVQARLDHLDLLELKQPWDELKDSIRERQDAYTPDLRPNCGNHCEATGTDLKRCKGCLSVYYCSVGCQVQDWLQGGHRQYCLDLRHRRLDAETCEISAQARSFITSAAWWRLSDEFEDYEKYIQAIEPPAVPVFQMVHRLRPQLNILANTILDGDEAWHRDVASVAANRGKSIVVSVAYPIGGRKDHYRRVHGAMVLPGVVAAEEQGGERFSEVEEAP